MEVRADNMKMLNYMNMYMTFRLIMILLMSIIFLDIHKYLMKKHNIE